MSKVTTEMPNKIVSLLQTCCASYNEQVIPGLDGDPARGCAGSKITLAAEPLTNKQTKKQTIGMFKKAEVTRSTIVWTVIAV